MEFDDCNILHVDLNCCYAQIECLQRPSIRKLPVVVGGDEEARHGIVLAKNEIAKKAGIGTACTLRDARKICPNVVVVPPNFKLYKQVSSITRQIYYKYSDRVEPFGIDECWLDVSNTKEALEKTPQEIASSIQQELIETLGLTTSIGVSWNKIFAKFGSDYKKPHAITAINHSNYKKIVWESGVRDLLFVGAVTERKLSEGGYYTIGDLANAPDYFLQSNFGKVGFMLRTFARGDDKTPVSVMNPDTIDVDRTIKSYGNGITFPRDICDDETARSVIHMLAESVAHRMREDSVRSRTVTIFIRDANTLASFSRQKKLEVPTNLTREICDEAWNLTKENYIFSDDSPVRGITVQASDLVGIDEYRKIPLMDSYSPRRNLEILDSQVDLIREKYGNNAVMWGAKASDDTTKDLDIKADNTVHPISFFYR